MDERERKQELRWKIMRFLQSRRNDETKKYVASIIDVLEKAKEEDSRKRISKSEVGWIRVKVLLDMLVGPDKVIKNATTFYRLVNDLAKVKIIDRRIVPIAEERMRMATYYRTTGPYQRWWFLSREQLEESHYKSLQCIRELTQQLVIARDLLEESGSPDPQQKIADEYKLLTEREPLSKFDVIPKHGFRLAYVWVHHRQVPVRRKRDLNEKREIIKNY